MRWEDERYVRIYTRDTPDWLGLSFVAQGLLCLLLRKVDRAGILPLGRQGKRAVAVIIGHAGDWSRLEPALEELLADGCVKVEGDVLVVPNFIEAQEASMSDAQRKREQRARARDIASRNGTVSHETGQNVTNGHTASQVVTPSLAVPCRTEPKKKKLATATPFAAARDRLVTVYASVVGGKYLWSGAKDAEGLKRILALGVSIDTIEDKWRSGLRGKGWASARTVAQLAAKWNDLEVDRESAEWRRAIAEAERAQVGGSGPSGGGSDREADADPKPEGALSAARVALSAAGGMLLGGGGTPG